MAGRVPFAVQVARDSSSHHRGKIALHEELNISFQETAIFPLLFSVSKFIQLTVELGGDR